MNKEEILTAFLLTNIPEIITQEEFDDVKKVIKELKKENKKYKEVIDNIRYYLEDSANQMSEEISYTLIHFLKEVQ